MLTCQDRHNVISVLILSTRSDFFPLLYIEIVRDLRQDHCEAQEEDTPRSVNHVPQSSFLEFYFLYFHCKGQQDIAQSCALFALREV